MTTNGGTPGRNRPPRNPIGTQVNRNGSVNAVAPADTVDLEALLEAVSGVTVTASTKIITPARGVRCGACWRAPGLAQSPVLGHKG